MSECLPDLPRYVRQRGDEWQGADDRDGPWRPIPAPQSGMPWPTDGPAVQSREPASVVADASPTPADRLALGAAAVAHGLAAIFRERYGSSARADWLDGVGCHAPGARQTVQEGR
jgi:hypothetical protein